MDILSYILLGFLCLRLIVSLLNWITQPVVRRNALNEFPLVSILIPARNEVLNIQPLVRQLRNLSYPNLEVIVLNDQSEDATEMLLKEASDTWKSFRYINGKSLPAGWLGKNWACHQLSQEAQGEYFLFLDADIAQLDAQLIQFTLGEMQQRSLALLSIFPDQLMLSLGERLVVPIMHYLLLSLLPLWWIYRLPFPSMSAANGQFMLFDAKAYIKYRWHEQVKTVIVEDIAIMQQIKQNRLKGMTFVAKGLIVCRMYDSFSDGVSGFSKNILAGFGNSIPGILIYLFLIFFGWGALLFYLSFQWVSLAILMMGMIRIAVSALANQSIVKNLFLHPIQIWIWVGISILSIYKKLSGKNEWKGRNLQLQS